MSEIEEIEATRRLLNEILDRFIGPNAETIAQIGLRREIAVLVGPRPSMAAQEALRNMGWDGTATVFPMPKAGCRALAAACLTYGDPTTHAWLTRNGKRKHPRVFVFVEGATLLMNYTSAGWSLEPGPNDRERAAALH